MRADRKQAAKRALGLALGVGVAAAAAVAPTARAQEVERAAGEDTRADARLADIERRLEASERRLRELRSMIAEEQRQLEADRQALARHLGRPESELGRMAARGVPGELAQAPSAPVGEAPPPPERPAAAARIFEEPTALTPRGKLVVEPSYQFVHATNNQVALVGYSVIPAITIGLIDIRRVSRDISTFALTARYGLTNRLELEAKLPWVSSRSTTQTRPLATPSVTDQFFDSSGSGIGDVELAARYQLNAFRGDNPVYIGYLRYKSRTGEGVFDVPIDAATGLQTELPTGSGFQAMQAGLTWLFPSDPAVFFGGAAYTYSFSRDVGNGFGTVRPGGVFDINLGMGLALNERSSFSLGYQHSIVGRTSQRDPESVARVLAPLGTLQLGTLRFGVAYRLSARTNLNMSLGIGVTKDTPDVELTLRVPFSF